MAAARVPGPVGSLGQQNSRVLVTALLVLAPLSCTARGQAAEVAGPMAQALISLLLVPCLLLGKLLCSSLFLTWLQPGHPSVVKDGKRSLRQAGGQKLVLYSTCSVLPDTDGKGLSPCLCQQGKDI